jgi:hypothetical protein
VTTTIEREHGKLVNGTGILVDIDDPDTLAKFRARNDPEDQRQLLLHFTGHCLQCETELSPEDDIPDKPGYRFVRCSWCREHRGKTHCWDCGAPLNGEAEEGFCPTCPADTEGEEEDD